MATTRHHWPMTGGFINTTSSLAGALNASTTYYAGVFCASKTGSIDRVVVRSGTVTGTSPTYEVRIETVTNGNPSGTLWATNTSETFTPVSNTTTTHTLTASASVTRGDFYAVVVRHNSGTIDGSNNSNFVGFTTAISVLIGNVNNFVATTNSGSSWSRTGLRAPSFLPTYSDNDVEAGCWLSASSTASSLSTSGITDMGCRFIAPMSASCVGAICLPGLVASNLPTLNLLDTSNNVLATEPCQVTAAVPAMILFTTPYAVTDGTDYRLVLSASTSTSVSITRYTAPSAAARTAMYGDAYYTSRTGSTWTDATDTAPILIPMFGSPTSGVGGGGGSLAFNPVVRLP